MESTIKIDDIPPLPFVDPMTLARLDVKEGWVKWRIWLMLAYQDIKLRYRRSILGPFWITLSMAITVYTMGFLYGHLFHMDLTHYYPFLVSSMICWGMISSLITDQSDAFMLSSTLIKQIKLPYTLYIHRVIARNFIIFAHNLIVLIPIFLLFPQNAHINSYSFLLLPGLILIYLNAMIFGLILAMIGSRYRDTSQIIKSFVQITFFVTPVLWSTSRIPEKYHYLIYANPFYSFLEIIRRPLLGQPPLFINLVVIGLTTFIGYRICKSLFVRYRSRIVYWL